MTFQAKIRNYFGTPRSGIRRRDIRRSVFFRTFVLHKHTRHATEIDPSRRLLADGALQKECRGRSPRHRPDGRHTVRNTRNPHHRPDPHGCSGDTARRCRGPVRRTGLRRARAVPGPETHGGAPRLGDPGRTAGRLRQPGIRTYGSGVGRLCLGTGIRPGGGRRIRRRAFVQHPAAADRRGTSRRKGYCRSGSLRRGHRPETCLAGHRRNRRRPAQGRTHAAHPAAALHPLCPRLPAPAEETPRGAAARMRRTSLRPLRTLRRTMPHRGHRPRRGGAHRPGPLHPLLRLRQGVPGRSPAFRDPPSPKPSRGTSPAGNRPSPCSERRTLPIRQRHTTRRPRSFEGARPAAFRIRADVPYRSAFSKASRSPLS